jgi:hypothetical protein
MKFLAMHALGQIACEMAVAVAVTTKHVNVQIVDPVARCELKNQILPALFVPGVARNRRREETRPGFGQWVYNSRWRGTPNARPGSLDSG